MRLVGRTYTNVTDAVEFCELSLKQWRDPQHLNEAGKVTERQLHSASRTRRGRYVCTDLLAYIYTCARVNIAESGLCWILRRAAELMNVGFPLRGWIHLDCA
ncbi:hypothetical protein MHYP_G00250070 [Metynnis hypsauchen]